MTLSTGRLRRQAINPELERSRLTFAMKDVQALTEIDERTGRARWEDVVECHVAYIKYECANGHRVALQKSCGFSVCPSCVPTRLRADFRRHEERLPSRVAAFVVTPPAGMTGRKDVAIWFRAWRRTSGLSAGFYGLRRCVGHPDVLLVVPADEVPGVLLASSAVQLVSLDVSLSDAIDWYVDMYLEELASWRTTDEMLDLVDDVKGRRRFQGFGRYYGATKLAAAQESDEQLFTTPAKETYRATGGSAKGGAKKLACPICKAKMRAVGIATSDEELTWDSENNCRLWGTGPPGRGESTPSRILRGYSMTKPEGAFMSVREAASYLTISTDLAYRLIKANELPHLQLGRRIVIPRFGLDQWIARQAGLPLSAPVEITSAKPREH